MRYRASAALLLVMATVTTTAFASESQDFQGCDGRMKPGRQEDGLRGEASTTPYQFSNSAAVTIQACTRALASSLLLPTQKLRRAHLLRARAAAYLETNMPDLALTDLDAAEAAAADLASDRFYQRSMGVSLKLLRALALGEKQNAAGAVPLAQAALAARPYALQIQLAGSAILQAARPLGTPSPSPWAIAYRLEPDAGRKALTSEFSVGNFRKVVEMVPAAAPSWPEKPLTPFDWSGRTQEGRKLFGAVIQQLDIAYARAATGDPAGAHQEVADVRDRLAKMRALLQPAPAKGPPVDFSQLTASMNEALEKFIARQEQRIDARIAVSEKRYDDAISKLLGVQLPKDAATLEVFSALAAAMPAKDRARVPDMSLMRTEIDADRQSDLKNIVKLAMTAPETPRTVVDYDKARPNILGALVGGAFSMGTTLLGGIKRTDGFRSTPNADGTVKVEFLGNTPSAALVQEMTLLRAAELTREAGKPAFVIVDRTDYSRTMNMSRNGMIVSSAPAGFKTELVVSFIDSGVQQERALDATQVIDALGPYYYQTQP